MKLLILILLAFTSSIGFSQVKIFKDYDFQSGEYALIFVDVTDDGDVPISNKKERKKALKQTAFPDTKNHFIIDSISILKEMQTSWIGENTDIEYLCWYNYFIYLTKNDSVVSEMNINFKCNELVVDGEHYVFDSSKVINFLRFADTLVKTDYRFHDNKRKAINNWQKIESDSSVLLKKLMRPFWVDFDGKFQIEFVDSTDIFGEPRLKMIMDKIKAVYPNENFKLKWASTSIGNGNELNEYSYKIICNKSLYDNFQLFTIEKEWEFYDTFEMTVYKRKPNR